MFTHRMSLYVSREEMRCDGDGDALPSGLQSGATSTARASSLLSATGLTLCLPELASIFRKANMEGTEPL